MDKLLKSRATTYHIDIFQKGAAEFRAYQEAQRQERAQALYTRTQELSAQIDEAIAQTPRLRGMKMPSTVSEAIAAHVMAAQS